MVGLCKRDCNSAVLIDLTWLCQHCVNNLAFFAIRDDRLRTLAVEKTQRDSENTVTITARGEVFKT